jgi:dethiobiotin synthetase/adenosylmethionine--8-amino-7-oxononanoate aminotransferase
VCFCCAPLSGDSKALALLHGHSYTAHPIGCSAGVAALQLYQDPSLNPNWCTPETANRCQREGQGFARCDVPCGKLLPLWSEAAIAELSGHPSVQGVMPLGTVLAVQLRAQDGVGYASNAAAVVVARLRQQGIFGRPLGDVVYLMVTPMTARAQCDALLAKLAGALDG